MKHAEVWRACPKECVSLEKEHLPDLFLCAKCLDMIAAAMVAFQHFRMSYAFLQPRYPKLEVAYKSVSL